MSMPEPMPCRLEECLSPMACNDAGICREARKDGARSYELALSECRKRNVIPESWRLDLE